MVENGDNKITRVYYAVRNDDGSFSELHCLGETVDDATITTDCSFADDLNDAVIKLKEELTATVEVTMSNEEWARWADAMAWIANESQSAQKSLEELAQSIPYDPPKRAGFRPKRKYWESDKDDPSTFGAYMNGKRRKKKRR